jgi:hypothetical protein
MAQNTARGTPAKVLLLFALLTGAVAVSAWRDWLRRDDEMFRVPLAVPLPRLYTISESWPADSVPPLYLKAAPGEYLRVALRKAGDF